MVRSTNNSLSSVSTSNASAGSSSSSSAVASSSGASTTLSANSEVLAQAFSKALGESLPGIFASFQAQLSTPAPPSSENLPAVACGDVVTDPCSELPERRSSRASPLYAFHGIRFGSFIYLNLLYSTTSRFVFEGGGTIVHGSPSNVRLQPYGDDVLHAHREPPATFDKAFVVGPGYAPIPYKLVGKITGGQFVDLADLLSDNIRAQ